MENFDVIFGDFLVSRRLPASELERELPLYRSLAALGASWGHVATFFAFFSHFFAFLGLLNPSWQSKWNFFEFLVIFDGFWEDSGRVLEGFFEDFSYFPRKRRSSKFVRPRSVS